MTWHFLIGLLQIGLQYIELDYNLLKVAKFTEVDLSLNCG